MKTRLFDIDFDALTMDQALEIISGWLRQDEYGCRMIVTPNTDHVVRLKTDPDFRTAYAEASLVLADGKPVVWASRLLGGGIPCTVPGSDLVPELFSRAGSRRPISVFLLGAGPGIADIAAANIQRCHQEVRVVGTDCPPLGFESDAAACARIVSKINAVQPDVLVVGLGAPKQELWIQRHREQLQVKVSICAGATIDFLAGVKTRAPLWMRRTGLEWLHRLSSEPRRLFRRYAHDGLMMPGIILSEWRLRQRHFNDSPPQ